MPTSQRFPEPGERIGPYEIVRELGRGGMGVVFEAVETGLQRRVALKVVAPALAGDPAFRARFAQEARAQASLDSPHVVPVYAHGEAGGALFLASRYLPDGDLRRLLVASGPLPLRTALDVVAQVADGLADAHAAGLVHRDIKPANVLLRAQGDELTAYLTDFGIAQRAGAHDAVTLGRSATGTPGYLAPELHAGAAPGVASDVYAVGCLLWAALTGGPPNGPAPQLTGRGLLERRVNRVLRTATAVRPGVRHPSAAALRDDLRGVARRRPARRGQRAAVVLAVAAAVILVGTGAARLGRDDAANHELGERAATARLAAALHEDGGLTWREARCTARALAERPGVRGAEAQDVVDAGVRCLFAAPSQSDPQPSATRTSPATVATYSVPSGPR